MVQVTATEAIIRRHLYGYEEPENRQVILNVPAKYIQNWEKKALAQPLKKPEQLSLALEIHGIVYAGLVLKKIKYDVTNQAYKIYLFSQEIR